MVLYQLPYRFHGLEAEMVEQRLTQIQADIQFGFAWQNFQNSLNCQIQVNLAQEVTGPKSKVLGGMRKLSTHSGNNFFGADLL
jgi:hypothetical protein